MRKLFFALIALPLLFSCNSSETNDVNIKLIEDYVSAVENLDYKSMEDLLSKDYLGLGPSFGDSIGKEQAIANWKFYSQNLYKKIHYNKSRNATVIVSDGGNAGDWVSNWAELEIEYQDGNEITLWANTIYQIKGGKICKSYTFYNEADGLRQMGYVFLDPQDLK
jgi:hypothetical protein